MAENISFKKITKANSNYLGEWDLPVDGSDVVVTIADAVSEVVSNPQRGISETKLVITFEEMPKKFICNTTNGNSITSALGTSILAEWVGKKIQLYRSKNIKVPGGTVPGIRVRPTAPTTSEPEYHCSVCGKLITKEIYNSSVAKYGKPYCGKECLDNDTKGKKIF